MLTARQERMARLCLVLCFCFLVVDRWLILHQFGYRFVDDDQAIMWNGGVEMAHGRFHEPCFYGQSYNTMLEGLVAVPLLWAGVGPDVALPVMTSVLTLFPFVLLCAALVRQRAYVPAAFMLAFPVALPPEYGMITSMPRGFVTGVFLSALAVLPLFSTRSIFLLLAPFFAILALFANPNAALGVAPPALLIMLRYRSDRRLYLLGMAGAVPAAILYYLGHHFYDVRPEYVVHSAWELSFSVRDIQWSNLRFLDELSPFLWGKGWFVLILLILLGIALGLKRQWKPAIALVIGIALLVASFGLNKVHDGIPSVFMPWARMFLAVPVLLALFIAQLNVRPPQWAVALMPLLAAGFFGFKCVEQAAAVERQVRPHDGSNVEVDKVADLRRFCDHLGQVARTNEADLLVISWGIRKHLTNYGCPCLVPDFPRTINPVLDRRTWQLRATAAQVVPNVLFAGFVEKDFAGMPVEKVSQAPLLFLARGNKLRTDSLLSALSIALRPI
ncbi:MAG: hypothetical protein WAU70_09380 [Flavobacteriales bacterium]